MTYNYYSWNIILLVCRNRTFFSSVSLITLSDRKLKSDIFELTRWYRNYFFFHLFQKHFSTQGKSWSRCNVVSIINRKQRSQNASKVRKQTKKTKTKKKERPRGLRNVLSEHCIPWICPLFTVSEKMKCMSV